MRGLRIFLSVSYILSLQAISVYSQEKYIIQHYTNENGLPAHGIKGIELDKKSGFLWVGTQAGLVRFDGKHFQRFGSDKKTGTASRISVIAKNREGTIYCEDENFSVYRVANNQPEWVMIDSFLIAPSIIRGGRYPAISAQQVAQVLRNSKRSSFLAHWMVFNDEPGDSSSFSFIYFGHAWHYSASEDTLLDFPDFNAVFKLDGHVYYARANLELWEYNNKLKKLLPVQVEGIPAGNRKGNEKPKLIWAPGMAAPLLIDGHDIWKLQHAGNTLRTAPVCRGCVPPNAEISSAQLWEEQGLIFLGSEVNGLYILKAPFVRSVRTDTTIEAGKVEYAQIEIAPGIVNTASGLSYSAQGQLLPGKTRIQFPHSNIYQDQHGDCWFWSGDTIIHFHQKDNSYTKITVNDGAVKMVFAATRNRQYVISDIAIAEITGDRYRPLYKLPAANTLKNSLNPSAAIEWEPGILAIATEKLVLFDTEKGKTPDTIPIPGLTAKVRSLLKYNDYLLIGTYGQGFYMYKNGVVKKMPLDKNSYLSYAHCFLPDDRGFCWISTNRGLFKVSLHALVTAYENNLDEIYYHYFGKDDGMFNTELNGDCQPCGLKLSSGLYSFPSMNGVVLVDPHRQHSPPPSGRIFIEEVLADSKRYQPADSALYALPWQFRNMRFRLALPQFGNTENIYCSYKLEPYNSDWETQDILQNNILQFGGLKPGTYTLYIRVRNGFNPDQFGIIRKSFRILKPWFQTWWFLTLVLLAFIASTWGLVSWRTARIARRKKELQRQVTAQTKNIEEQSRQLEQQLQQLQDQQIKLEEDNKIKARLIGIISHDMVSPIRFMGFLAKRLRDTFTPSDPGYQTANAFVNVSQELESLSVNMLHWISIHHNSYQLQPEQFDLHTLVNESVEIAATLAMEKGVQLHNDVPNATYLVQYRQALGVIVYNLTMNAMKYTESGEIRIKTQQNNDQFSLIIIDTGVGMSPQLIDMLNKGESFVLDNSTGEMKKFQFGYLIIKDLLQLIQGIMKIESTLNEGTQVTIQFNNIEM